MKELNVNGHLVIVKDSPEELTLEAFKEFNRHLLIDAGLGSSTNDWNHRVSRVQAYMKAGKMDEAFMELNNSRLLVQGILEGLNPKMAAFACLVVSIDGEPCEDFTDTGIRATIKKLSNSGLTFRWMQRILEAAKKKVDAEMAAFFPGKGVSPDLIQAVTLLRRRTRMLLMKIQDGTLEFNDQEVVDIDQEMLMLFPPAVLAGKGNEEVDYVASFEKMVAGVSKYMGFNCWSFSVLRLHQTLALINENQPKK